jgi:hypothetical protein
MFKVRLSSHSLLRNLDELHRTNLFGVLPLEHLSNNLLYPLFIFPTSSRMPAVQAIELNAADITTATLEE